MQKVTNKLVGQIQPWYYLDTAREVFEHLLNLIGFLWLMKNLKRKTLKNQSILNLSINFCFQMAVADVPSFC